MQNQLCRGSLEQWKTSGGRTRPRSYKLLLTIMTQEASMKQSRSCMSIKTKHITTPEQGWCIHPHREVRALEKMAGALLQAAEQTRNHGSTGQSAPSIHSVWARCSPHTGWGHQSHQRAKTQQTTRAWWHCSLDRPVWWWYMDTMHAPAVHKAVESWRTTIRLQKMH